MSWTSDFKISIKQLQLFSAIILVGIAIASFFIHFSPDELCLDFSSRLETYYSFSGTKTAVLLILQEFFWILMIMILAFIPYGRIIVLFIILYKGFSIGIVASLICWQYGTSGLMQIFIMLLPPNVIYIFSICIASQISFEVSANLSVSNSRHGRFIPTDRRAYWICFVLTILAGLIEVYYSPWIYQVLFK